MRLCYSAAAALLGAAGLASIAAADPANIGKVIITEIFANPNDSDGGGFGIRSVGDNLEFIEIFNTTNDPIDISGWYLDDEDPTASVPFPPGTILGPRQALVIIGAQLGLRPTDPLDPTMYLPETAIWTTTLFNTCWDPTPGDGNAPARNVLIIPGNITIANTPTISNEVPFLVDADGTVIDVVSYGAPGFPAVTAGQSLVLRPQFLNAVDNDRGCAWQLASADPLSITSNQTDFVFPETGTPLTRDRLADAGNTASPGFVNETAPPATDCNNNGISDLVETCGTTGPTVPDCNGNLIPDSCEPDCNGNGIPDVCDASFNREFQDCNLNNVPDFCDINAAGGVNGIGGPLDLNSNGIIDGCEDSGKVIITEIMVDPFISPQLEWVEIYNRSATPVDISGYRLLDLETGGDGYTLPVPAGNSLQPGEVAVLAAITGTQTPEDMRLIYEAVWGATTPGGQPIRFIPLGKWGARATNATPNAEILTLVRGAQIDDAAAAAASSTAGPHPTRTTGPGGVTWVTNPGFVVDVANFSNVNSNGEQLAGWPGSDSHSSFSLNPNALDATSNNTGSNWRLSIAGLNGSRISNDLTGNPSAPVGFSNFGEDYGSPGFVPTGAPQVPTGEVLISEIAATTNSIYPGSNPTPVAPQTIAAGRDEFVEIVNVSASPVDISGWYLQDEDGRTQSFPAGTVLQPNEAAVIIGVDTDAPTGTNQPGLQPLTGRDFVEEFTDAWGCGYKVIGVTDWYTSNRAFGLDRLADAPSFTNEILRLVKADGVPSDVVNYDDDAIPPAIAPAPFGWPGDAVAGILTWWSIYTLPGFYTSTDNDFGPYWAASLTGFDGGRQSVINTAVDGSGYPTGLFNRDMFGTPGFVQGLTGPVTPPGSGCECLADFNGSGAVTVQDIFDFLAAYFAALPSADVNDSGSVTVQDIFDYLSLYFAGCN